MPTDRRAPPPEPLRQTAAPPGGAPATGPGYRDDVRAVLAEMLEGRADTRPGLMFGFPAFYASGKLVACVYGTGVGLRVDPDEARRLGAHTRSFEPYGRRMRAWVFLEPQSPGDVREAAGLLEAAIARARRESRTGAPTASRRRRGRSGTAGPRRSP